ncbi:DUF2141 domain-containing protein [Emticicia sp. BO119]|uniref:DUF2141 domain-containing protein n=1 Tax=Emticicia sp. BO119 TaxID=2757768 RepID=UPI0015EFE5B9|nr:DUF2141 domain-containing protein [Emticicia sp. BO119]MBA4849541.1 DUF2141 domain-containing protein [Emticicia sp. BO119]
MKKILFFMLISAVTLAQNPKLKVHIKGFENNKGKLMLEVLDAKKKSLKRLIQTIENRQVMVEIQDLSSGQYSVRVFHDENDNRKLDTGMFGIPKEAWGMSNNVKAIMGPPDFKESLFWLKEDKALEIVLK